MRDPRVSAVGVLPVIAAALVWFAPALVSGRSQRSSPSPASRTIRPWEPPRTAWGDPDFDGVWNFGTIYACHEGNERSVIGSLSGTLAITRAEPK